MIQVGCASALDVRRFRKSTDKIMPLIKFTDDQIVKRLRWVMMAVMLFSLFNTLSGQPQSFWHHPETAIRGDGLSIHNETNHWHSIALNEISGSGKLRPGDNSRLRYPNRSI